MHADLQQDAGFVERFNREARTLARLDHPHIVRVYDFGHRDGVLYLVMELVDGVSLRHAITHGGIKPQEALSMVPRICDALQYAHDHGVVHRDIKPENILLDRTGNVKVADFGLAKVDGASSGARLTQTRQVMGTPHYMAPEQIETPTDVDHRADIYALGVVFYEMLTGELPVGRFPPPSQKVDVDVRLDEVVLRTLEKEPRLRYQQASELRTAVESLSDPDWTPTRFGRTPTRRGTGREALAAWVFEMAGVDVEAEKAKKARRREAKAARRHRRRSRDDDYEYRSKRTVWGFPLIHVVHSGDPSGQRMRLARGIIAIGDVAIGVVAVGGMAFGGVTVAGMSVGLVSISGLSVGLLFALGGIALGGFAVGGVAFGFVTNAPGPDSPTGLSLLSLAPETAERISLLGWGLSTLVVTAAATAVILAFIRDPPQRVD